jgi:hypothetical protein
MTEVINEMGRIRQVAIVAYFKVIQTKTSDKNSNQGSPRYEAVIQRQHREFQVHW